MKQKEQESHMLDVLTNVVAWVFAIMILFVLLYPTFLSFGLKKWVEKVIGTLFKIGVVLLEIMFVIGMFFC